MQKFPVFVPFIATYCAWLSKLSVASLSPQDSIENINQLCRHMSPKLFKTLDSNMNSLLRYSVNQCIEEKSTFQRVCYFYRNLQESGGNLQNKWYLEVQNAKPREDSLQS